MTVTYPVATLDGTPLRYCLSFTGSDWIFQLVDEVVENGGQTNANDRLSEIYYQYRLRKIRPVLNVFDTRPENRFLRHLQVNDLKPDQSILSQLRDPFAYPEQLKIWIEEYGLGELWTRGHIGGNRW